MRGKPKKGKRAKRRQWRMKRACFEEGPRFSGAKHTETGWADGVFLHHAGRKDFFDTLRQRETAAFSDILGGIVMKLTWLGHACFLLEEDGYRIVLDPYTGVAGYPPLHIQAHAVFCSHGHFDHHATDCVELLPERESPFTVREVETFHDDRGGALRGTNTVRIFTAGGLSVAHLGDLGHQLTAEQAAAVDVPALRRFLESPLAEEMRQAETAAREYRFTVLMPARDYDPAAAEEDSILLQGVVDCWFETPEGITVVDFKTDFVQTEEDVAQHAELYRGQLAAYSLALERVLEKAVTRKALYFLQAGKTVEIS